MKTTQPGLLIDPARGMAGDMFSAALLGLGVPQGVLLVAMETAARRLGQVSIEAERVPAAGDVAVRLHIRLEPIQTHLPAGKAWGYLEEAIIAVGLDGPYAHFARRALGVLVDAEREVHGGGSLPVAAAASVPEADLAKSPPSFTVTAIGAAHTPYHHQAPYQPSPETGSGEDDFFVEVWPEYAAGLADLTRFSHVFVISYLDRSTGYSLDVTPPWQGQTQARGPFGTRSPNRPNPIGISRVPIRRVEGNRLYLGQLDLFDGTPVLDLKPYIETLDGASGNDGWLEGSDHLEMHRRGIPHQHGAEGTVLHEAQDILIDVVGAAVGLQYLGVDLAQVICLSPVRVGGGFITFSHGRLPVPAPATRTILEKHGVPYAAGPVEQKLLTPTGAALLAALEPEFRPRDGVSVKPIKIGIGRGLRRIEPPGDLRLGLVLL